MKRLITFLFCLMIGTASFGVIPRGRGFTFPSGATETYTDENEADLLLRYYFDPTWTNASGEVVDTSGGSRDAIIKPNVAAGPVWTEAGTNEVGRKEHYFAFDANDDHLDLSAHATDFTFTKGFAVSWWYKGYPPDGSQWNIMTCAHSTAAAVDYWEVAQRRLDATGHYIHAKINDGQPQRRVRLTSRMFGTMSL